MGILDAPVLIRSKVGSAVTHELANGVRNVNMCVISDSTGVDTVEQATGSDRRWVYLLAQLIGVDFPAYTVLHRQWNATNLNYDAASTIQTGSGTGNGGGPFTFTVYGATKSGATAAYWLGELFTPSTVFPVAMELVLIADAHNEVGHGSDTRGTFWGLQRAVQYLAPGVQIAWVTQNPQNGAGSGSSAAEQTNQLLRIEEQRKLARSEGVGVIDVQPAFLADPSYASNLLIADGVHPNAAGSVLWAAQAKQHFPKARDQSGIAPGGPIPKSTRVWVPASSFVATIATPTLTAIQGVPCWAMPTGGVDTGIGCSVDWPAAWQTVNVYLVWALVTSETNHVFRARVSQQRIAGTFEPGSGSGVTLSGVASPGSVTSITGRAANVVGYSQIYSNTNATTGFTGRPMNFQAVRVNSDVLDTVTQSVNFLGLLIERAS